MTDFLTLEQVTHFIIPCILNNLITLLILYRFMKTFLGYKPELKKVSLVLYTLFFILENIISFYFEISLSLTIPHYLDKYLKFGLYIILLILIISIAFCYKPTLSTGFSSGILTALSLYCSIPIANYIYDKTYQFIVPNFNIFQNTALFRHVFYIIFEEYQQVFIYVLEITIKLLFLFTVLRVKHIYDERNMYYTQASAQQKNNLKLKQFHHDIKNHIIALNHMISSDENIKALEYLSKPNEMSDSSQLFSHTENVALDSIINYKLCEARQKDIVCTFHSSVPEFLNIRDEDIIIILGNLLDNAIEACLKLEDNKYIHLNLNYSRGILFISIANSYNGSLKKGSNSNIITSKKDKSLHGLGLKNIQNALEHYDGSLEIKTSATEFEIFIIMYISAGDENP